MLTEKLRSDALEMRKAKDPNSDLMRTLLGEIELRTKAQNPARDLTDDEVLGVVRKFIKGAKETLGLVKDEAAIEAAKREIACLEAYLPKQMSEDELKAVIQPLVDEGKNMGQIMGALKAGHAGLYEGRTASNLAKVMLG